MQYTITIRATSIAITPGKEAMTPLATIINNHTVEDEYSETVTTIGVVYDDINDVLYLHRGIDLQYLQNLLGNTKVIIERYTPFKEMKYDFEETIPPRDEDQEDVINFIAGINEHKENHNDSQIFLVKAGGFGKSYCSGYGAGVCGLRTIIIMHRDSLRSQWMNSLFNMNGYPHNRVYELTSTEELYDIAIGKLKLDYDIYLMTHATFRAGLKRIQDLELMQNIPKALGIGFKIIDEAHLEFKDTLLVDIVFNVKRNLYLTATDGRSSKDENAIFKHVFSKATYYKKKELLKKDNIPSKWVEYISIQINTHVKPNIYRFRVNGGKGMSPATYGKWVIQYDKKQTHFKVCTECLREIYKNEPQAKVLVFMPLIDLCTECAYYISKTLNYDESFPYDLNVKTVNSHNSKMENERNKSADVIVTTIMSLGTGSDIKGITDIICCSPFVSRITAQQVFWRIRYIPKQCHYYDIIDSSVPADIYWWKSRSKTFKRMCTKYKQLSWYEDEEENKND